MTAGLVLGIFFFLNFICSTSSTLILKLISYVIIANIIYFTIKNTIRYREKYSEGVITYGRVFQYVTFLFLFAGLISSVLKIFYLQYINPEYLPAIFEESVRQIEQNRAIFEKLNLNFDDKYFEELERQMKPINYSIQSIWVNILLGLILGFFLGFFIKKQKSIFSDGNTNQTEIQN
ncbi:hypothetical protein MASR2M117_05510 [Paludibacter sp.]